MVKQIYDQLIQMAHYLPKIEQIHMELKPNGGSSLRDAVNRIESNLSKQKLYTRALVKTRPGGTFNCDEHGDVTEVNKPMCLVLGRTESELLGDNWVKWVHVDDRAQVVTEWRRCLDQRSDFDMDMKFVLPDKSTKKVNMVAYRIEDDKGFYGFLGTLTVIYGTA